jgi:hypothetical protein
VRELSCLALHRRLRKLDVDMLSVGIAFADKSSTDTVPIRSLESLSCRRDFDHCIEASLARGEVEDVNCLVRNRRGTRCQPVQPFPTIAHPHCPRWNTFRHLGIRLKLAALIIDANRGAVLETSGGGIQRRDPQARRWVELSQRGQSAPMIVKAMEMRQRASLAQRQRIR